MKELTDLEICKRIAEIESNKIAFDESNDNQVKILIQTWCDTDSCYFDDYLPYNPLTDDGLCFQLMVTHRISVDIRKDGRTQAFMDCENSTQCKTDKNTNRAILLAIIEVHS